MPGIRRVLESRHRIPGLVPRIPRQCWAQGLISRKSQVQALVLGLPARFGTSFAYILPDERNFATAIVPPFPGALPV